MRTSSVQLMLFIEDRKGLAFGSLGLHVYRSALQSLVAFYGPSDEVNPSTLTI